MRLKNRIDILTEKGKVKNDIRTTLLKHVANKPDLFAKATNVGHGIYEVPVHNADNTETVYIRFEVKISEKSANELAPKTKTKTPATAEDIEVE